MIKKYLRSTIIVLAQWFLPILALLILTPWLLSQSSTINSWQHILSTHNIWVLALHGLFYLTFILGWPKLITRLQQHRQISTEQLNIAINTRWVLLATFLLLDALMLWR